VVAVEVQPAVVLEIKVVAVAVQEHTQAQHLVAAVAVAELVAWVKQLKETGFKLVVQHLFILVEEVLKVELVVMLQLFHQEFM
jgi:hypothetical protein